MKNKSKIFKYTVWTFLTFIICFSVSQITYADTYATPCPNDNGKILTTVGLTGGNGPYSKNVRVTATASVLSSCSSSVPVKVTAQNNSTGTIYTMINSSVTPGTSYPYPPASQSFVTPSASGSYAIHFITNVTQNMKLVTEQDSYSGGECYPGSDTYPTYVSVIFRLVDKNTGALVTAAGDVTINANVSNNYGPSYSQIYTIPKGQSGITIEADVNCDNTAFDIWGINSVTDVSGNPISFSF